jgi:acetylornithine deacetylase/succinyl-diaminopimelate desuccinylase-like protein
MRLVICASILSLLAGAASAQPAASPDRERFFDTYKQLVEINTAFSNGDCTLAAQRMADRLRAAGFPASDVKVMTPDGRPREGLVTAVLPGKDRAAKAILLLGHIDVVEARREDWERDPFKLIEENGYVFGRGAVDMKLMDAIWVDTLVRFKETGQTPRPKT